MNYGKAYLDMVKKLDLFAITFELMYGSSNYVFDGDPLPDIQSVNKVNQSLLEKAGESNATRNS